MALRYLARRIGVPALRRALSSRLAQPASTPRHLSSSSHQLHCMHFLTPRPSIGGGCIYPPPKSYFVVVDADVARLKAEFAAKCEALREACKKEEEANSHLLLRACLVIGHSTHKEKQKSEAFRAMLLE